MSSYFIYAWKRQLKGTARSRAETAVKAIDPSAIIVCHNAPGNDIHMWLERPNDRTNDDNYRRERNRRCIEAVEAELAQPQ